MKRHADTVRIPDRNVVLGRNPVMMGLQATATKRNLEEGASESDDSDWTFRPQVKVVRTEGGAGAGGVGDDWGVDSTSAALATSLLSDAAEDSDEEDDEDDVEEGDEATSYLPSGRGYQLGYSSSPPTYDSAGYQYCGTRSYGRGYWGPPQPSPPAPAGYYRQDVVSPVPSAAPPTAQPVPPQQPIQPSHQQTIRCDENGKSYLDLGSSSSSYLSSNTSVTVSATKCCDGSRTSWCARGPGSCYRQRRLAVLNLSMCKLGRYRQFSDPSLRRSVLICNTLRLLEREMEQDGCFFGAPSPREPCATSPSTGLHQPPTASPVVPYHHQQFPEMPASGYPPATPYRVPEPTAYEQNFRELTTPLRPTPFPSPAHPGCDSDSGLGDDDSTKGINWGSVLSLSSQSDLDPLNNNELFPSPPSPVPSHSDSLGLLGDDDLGHEFDDFLPSWKLTPLSADDLLKSVPSTTSPAEGELDSIMHVLVGT